MHVWNAKWPDVFTTAFGFAGGRMLSAARTSGCGQMLPRTLRRWTNSMLRPCKLRLQMFGRTHGFPGAEFSVSGTSIVWTKQRQTDCLCKTKTNRLPLQKQRQTKCLCKNKDKQTASLIFPDMSAPATEFCVVQFAGQIFGLFISDKLMWGAMSINLTAARPVKFSAVRIVLMAGIKSVFPSSVLAEALPGIPGCAPAKRVSGAQQ